MSDPDIERLRSIKTFPSLVKYPRDELDWPIGSDDFDELTFDYEPEELGLDAKTAVNVKDIKQVRPLAANQPWGIFFINFEPKRLPVVVLRRILRALVIKKRQPANKSQQATWNLHDLLFISSYGETDHRDVTFAHFAEEDGTGDLPTLRVLGWDDEDTVLHLADADQKLREKLRWPEDSKSLEDWRSQWSSAFTLPRTMKAKWRRERHMELEIPKLWNEYVAAHLLPRLYGFELMMAPYAIAHMKLGLKLHETGYNFRSHERARIYLTNTLEEPKDFSDRFEFDAPALAHEAHAVNAIKRSSRFTVVVGNPPYSKISANLATTLSGW